ncbi:zinc-dependent alcohol dehydrogenase family protein [Litoribacillus peritrichatus]|uniref:Zinc-dependent alcohol dehydrogenase family protein n=1 Tax=Litoribacillus peritrichatus TaxID=718191 RepID=A0ABP7MEZ3_9GAMM
MSTQNLEISNTQTDLSEENREASSEHAKVVRFHQTGDVSVLRMETLPILAPEKDEVQIKVRAIGLNRAEVMFRNGAYIETPELPSRLGYEASGVVEAVGSEVTNVKVGDFVSTVPAFSMSKFGVYGESANVPSYAVVKSPVNFTAAQSASIWMQYITAYGALIDIGKLARDQFVLITAASSSVGVAAIQIARSRGAKVIATTRRETKKQFLLDKGADHVVVTDQEDLVFTIEQLTEGEGVALIFDAIGGPLLSDLAEVAGQGGMIIEYGALDGAETPYPLFTALAKGLTIRGYTLFELTQDMTRLEHAKAFLMPLFESGVLIPEIDKVFSFHNIAKAHEYMESNQQMGKIVVDLTL